MYQQELFAAITEGVVLCAHLQLCAATLTSPDDPATDASAQRDRSLGNDAKGRLGSMPANGAVKSRSTDRRIDVAIDAESPIG